MKCLLEPGGSVQTRGDRRALLDLEKADCLTGKVRGGIGFGEGAVGDARSACAPSELPESMVLGTASPGWRLNACVPLGLWSPCSFTKPGTASPGWRLNACVPSGLWSPCSFTKLGTASPGWRLNACVPSGVWSPCPFTKLGTASPGWRLNACVPSGLWSPCSFTKLGTFPMPW